MLISFVQLSDGICASTCALFVDFMTLDAGVRTFTVGGRPQFGPTQPVGGTKGSQVLFAEQLQAYAQIALQVFPETRRQFREVSTSFRYFLSRSLPR